MCSKYSPEYMEQAAMIQFVKIIERFPDIYDHNLETYRRYTADKAWDKVVETVKAEMSMECTLEELKSKWKGIRSSYNRCRNKLIEDKRKGITSKKYYLYDALRFLEPFTKPKGFIKRSTEENVFQDCDIEEEDYEQESTSETDSKWGVIEIKPDPIEAVDETNETNCYSDTDDQQINKKSKKRKHETKDSSESNEDLHFFRSILPDIADFTTKEKRKLKIGILKLVDDIENQRQKKQRKSRSDDSSSS
ncbi:hypothetical protein ABMA27_000846 [Loxostege sticticalis]|uniref:MADF domain-containing protein n=1 Tax=Loxostege sticticalis TaxID=481309 RepID=A0ABR3I0L0_LOXSC